MTKADVLAGIAAVPVPFELKNGARVLLRPIRFGDRLELAKWWDSAKGEPAAGAELLRRLVVLSLSDASGNQLLTAEDVSILDAGAVDAIAEEVSKRNGIGGPGE